jgi:hypothetical protein
MIQAKELRIGNWVYDREDKCDIQIMDLDDLRYFMYYEPIPLTEEWLLKFEFEKKNNQYILDDYCVELIFDKTGWLMGEFDFNVDNFNYIGTNINYIHQLQNLYFALTGEELILK